MQWPHGHEALRGTVDPHVGSIAGCSGPHMDEALLGAVAPHVRSIARCSGPQVYDANWVQWPHVYVVLPSAGQWLHVYKQDVGAVTLHVGSNSGCSGQSIM